MAPLKALKQRRADLVSWQKARSCQIADCNPRVIRMQPIKNWTLRSLRSRSSGSSRGPRGALCRRVLWFVRQAWVLPWTPDSFCLAFDHVPWCCTMLASGLLQICCSGLNHFHPKVSEETSCFRVFSQDVNAVIFHIFRRIVGGLHSLHNSRLACSHLNGQPVHPLASCNCAHHSSAIHSISLVPKPAKQRAHVCTIRPTR